MNGSEHNWSDLDDTVADGPAPADVPAEARAWLAEQRTMHGLLRALGTADAAAREGRVQAILERIDADAARTGRRHWGLVAAAALLLATLGFWWSLPAALPTAEAAVERALLQLDRDVDRRFAIRVRLGGDDGRPVGEHDFALTTRPGGRFLLEGQLSFAGLQLGGFVLGSDGETFWVDPENPRFRRSGPLAERERLVQGLGEVLDLGYLDVRDFVRRLPSDFDVRVVERVVDARGRATLRIEATPPASRPGARLRGAELRVDEQSGMVVLLTVAVRPLHGGQRELEIEHLGEALPGEVDYRRPW